MKLAKKILGDLTPESILSAGAETDEIDFKRSLSDDKEGHAELARDCAGMANAGGGIIIFGVEDGGELTGVEPGSIALYDPTKINDKIAKYLSPNPTILSAIVKFKDKMFPFLYVDGIEGVPILISQGQNDSKNRVIFRHGDIFIRSKASTTVVTTESQMRKIIERSVNYELEKRLAILSPLFQHSPKISPGHLIEQSGREQARKFAKLVLAGPFREAILTRKGTRIIPRETIRAAMKMEFELDGFLYPHPQGQNSDAGDGSLDGGFASWSDPGHDEYTFCRINDDGSLYWAEALHEAWLAKHLSESKGKAFERSIGVLITIKYFLLAVEHSFQLAKQVDSSSSWNLDYRINHIEGYRLVIEDVHRRATFARERRALDLSVKISMSIECDATPERLVESATIALKELFEKLNWPSASIGQDVRELYKKITHQQRHFKNI